MSSQLVSDLRAEIKLNHPELKQYEIDDIIFVLPDYNVTLDNVWEVIEHIIGLLKEVD